MRRYTFIAASLAGLTTLLAGATAMGGPPGKKHPRGATSVSTNGGNITIIVNPPAQPAADASAAAEKAEKAPATDKAQKLSQNDKDKASKADESPTDRAKRGVVLIERAGEVVGLGTVLANDGRVLTALSPLGDGNNLDLRYADGSVSHAKVGHSDRLWDLAMLVPAAGKWPEGLQASEQDPLAKGSKLSGFAPGKAGKVLLAPLSLKSKKSLFGADETLLRDVFEVGNKVGPKELGGPIVDDHGDVVGVLGRACVPVEKGPCAPTPFGVPVPALRSFLSKAPPSALQPMQPPPWLGVQGTAEKGAVQGVKVTGVAPESPAEDAGVKAPADKAPGDIIVAVDDQPVATPEALSKQIQQKSTGDRVKLLLFGNGKFRESTLVLKPAPQKK